MTLRETDAAKAASVTEYSGIFVPVTLPDTEPLVNWGHLETVIERRWKLVALPLVLVTTVGAAIALTIPPKYIAEAFCIAVPPEESGSGIASSITKVGGLASLFGGTFDGDDGISEEAMAILESRAFAMEFIERQSLMPLFFADDWDAEENKWKNPANKSTMLKAYGYLNKYVLSLSSGTRGGPRSVTVTWTDSTQAAEWANEFVLMADEKIRVRVLASANSRLD